MDSLPTDRDHPTAFTFVGKYHDSLNVRFAWKVALACGINHCVLRLSTDFLSDYAYLVKTLFGKRTLARPYWNAGFVRRMMNDHN
jgi:hypothetical protein